MLEYGLPLFCALLFQFFCHNGVKLKAFVHLILPRIAIQAARTEYFTQLFDWYKSECNVPIGRAVDSVRRLVQPCRQTCRGSLGQSSSVHIVSQRFQLKIQRRSQQTRFHAVALAASLPIIYSANDPQRGQYRPMLVDRGCANRGWRILPISS